jgi:hypothetical protein
MDAELIGREREVSLWGSDAQKGRGGKGRGSGERELYP